MDTHSFAVLIGVGATTINPYLAIDSIRQRFEKKLFVRDDITPQIIRITSSRFKNKIRPIKLCYYGEVIRKKGSILRPERQFLQVGAEIIGSDSIYADIEV